MNTEKLGITQTKRARILSIVALIGLLGILIGEQVPTLLRHVWRGEPIVFSWVSRIRPHVFGSLPQGEPASRSAADEIKPGGGSPA